MTLKQKVKVLRKRKLQPRNTNPKVFEDAIGGLLEMRKEKIGGIKAANANYLATVQDALNLDEKILLTMDEYISLLKKGRKARTS